MVVEAMVAVLIVALMAGLWFETLGSAARRQRGGADRRMAMLVAQSQLATVGVLNAVIPGSVTGQDGEFAWRIAVEPAESAGLAQVTVSVSRPGGRPLATLQTLRLGR